MGLGIVLLVIAARLFVPSSLSPTEEQLVGTWKRISPEPSTMMVLGSDGEFRITGASGQTQPSTGRWSASKSMFVYTIDATRTIGLNATRFGWGRREFQLPILQLDGQMLRLGT